MKPYPKVYLCIAALVALLVVAACEINNPQPSTSEPSESSQPTQSTTTLPPNLPNPATEEIDTGELDQLEQDLAIIEQNY